MYCGVRFIFYFRRGRAVITRGVFATDLVPANLFISKI